MFEFVCIRGMDADELMKQIYVQRNAQTKTFYWEIRVTVGLGRLFLRPGGRPACVYWGHNSRLRVLTCLVGSRITSSSVNLVSKRHSASTDKQHLLNAWTDMITHRCIYYMRNASSFDTRYVLLKVQTICKVRKYERYWNMYERDIFRIFFHS